MSFKFSKTSLFRLNTCDEKLQKVFNKVIEIYDFSVLEGYRSEELQTEYFLKGLSKIEYPNSKHNEYPSKAIDIAPWPINWNDRESFIYLAGIVKGVSQSMGIPLRWGGDWDSDNDLKDQNFMDLVHFELK